MTEVKQKKEDDLQEEMTADVQRETEERSGNVEPAGVYDTAVNAMKKAYSEAAFKAAAGKFRSISGFRDADALAEECLEKAEICRKDAIYAAAADNRWKRTLSGCKTAVRLYESIPGWKDADKKQVEAKKAAKIRMIITAVLVSVAVLCAAATVLYFGVYMPGVRYQAAVELYEAGQYKDAARAFRALHGYKDSMERARQCEAIVKDWKYENALTLMEEGRYRTAITEFTLLDGYKESDEKLTECTYLYAAELFRTGKYKEAVLQYMNVNGYLDSKERAAEAYDRYQEADLKTADVEDYILFGMYEQDNVSSNGKEYIEWRVLEKTGDSMLIISVYALDCQKYNEENANVTWETCSLRSWLNGDFLNAAFDPDEQKMIQKTNVTADKNPQFSTAPGNSTEDMVFLLSASEVEAYESLDYARKCQVTEYCIAQGVYKKGTYRLSADDICWWWLRSPGRYSSYAAYTLTNGAVYCNGRSVDSGQGAVRPVLWINPEF